MAKFVVLYHAPRSAIDKMKDMTPEDIQKGMEPWVAWAAKCGAALVDFGSPLGAGLRLTKGGASASQNDVTGYSILEAADMDAAKAMLSDHPHLEWAEGGGIEVHEPVAMGM